MMKLLSRLHCEGFTLHINGEKIGDVTSIEVDEVPEKKCGKPKAEEIHEILINILVPSEYVKLLELMIDTVKDIESRLGQEEDIG